MAKGQQEKALDKAVFSAKKGSSRVPSRPSSAGTSSRSRRSPPRPSSRSKQATETIKNLLRSQRQQKTLDDWIKNFREDYKADTNCASDYEVAECKNGPDETTDTGAASGGSAPGPGPARPAAAPQPQSTP